jgi:hypothetical protein
MKMLETRINYDMSPFAATHNMPCPICRSKKAILKLTDKPHDFFSPCWDCQGNGWFVAKCEGWKRKVINYLIGDL